MKPWQINTIIIIAFILIVIFVPSAYSKYVSYIIVFGSAFGAGLDAKKLNINKYKVPGYFPGTPGMVSVAIIFLWLIYLPLYISFRKKLIDGKIPLKDNAASMPTPPSPIK